MFRIIVLLAATTAATPAYGSTPAVIRPDNDDHEQAGIIVPELRAPTVRGMLGATTAVQSFCYEGAVMGKPRLVNTTSTWVFQHTVDADGDGTPDSEPRWTFAGVEHDFLFDPQEIANCSYQQD